VNTIPITVTAQDGITTQSYAVAVRRHIADGTAATLVLGQANFTSVAPNAGGVGPANNTLKYPYGLVVDPVSGKVFVADTHNHRVLRFANIDALWLGAAAEAVFGQPNLSSGGSGTSDSGMHEPLAVAIARDGVLFVVDGLNNRVLRFDNAASKSSGAPADGVLGQPDFTSWGRIRA
jgi:DNA-binding beta-propeller fold protein YncE